MLAIRRYCASPSNRNIFGANNFCHFHFWWFCQKFSTRLLLQNHKQFFLAIVLYWCPKFRKILKFILLKTHNEYKWRSKNDMILATSFFHDQKDKWKGHKNVGEIKRRRDKDKKGGEGTVHQDWFASYTAHHGRPCWPRHPIPHHQVTIKDYQPR